MLPLLLLAIQAVHAGNLAQGRPVEASGAEGNPAVLTDGRLEKEGMAASGPAVLSLRPGGSVVVDLGETSTLKGLVVQADAGSRVRVEASVDGRTFALLATLPDAPRAGGLVTRAVQFRDGRPARVLRVAGEPGRFVLAEIQAYAELPAVWPPPQVRGQAASAPPLTLTQLRILKLVIGIAGTALLFAGWWRRRSRGPETRRSAFDAALMVAGILGFAAWWNFGVFHLDHFLHLWDFHGQYISAKYFRELEYTRLYACTAAAELDLGHGDEIAGLMVRDLETNRLEPAPVVLRDPGACRSRFTPGRWEAFKRDTAWFRSRLPLERWHAIKRDHGFNATPAWAIAGALFANTGPASERQIFALALLDPLLLVGLMGAIIWAFGWRVACVAALFLGTNSAADFGWLGGCFLRFDWLALTVFSFCLLRKGHPLAAGSALAYAALLRIFPAFLIGGLVLRELGDMLRRRGGPRSVFLRFALGGLTAAAVLLVLSSVIPGGGPGAWEKFAANSAKHLASPSINNMGLKSVLSFVPDAPLDLVPGAEPAVIWWEPHRAAFERRKFLYVALLALFVALLARSVEREEHVIAMVLGVGLIPFGATLSCYYSVIFLAYSFLWPRKELAGALLCALGPISLALALVRGWEYQKYVLFSLACVAIVILITVLMGRAPDMRDTNRDPA